MRLKTLTYSLALGFILALTFSAISLVIFSDRLKSDAESVGQAVRSVHASGELQARLLSHNRESFLLSLKPNEFSQRFTRLLEDERKIWYWLNEAERHTGAEDQTLVNEVRETITHYLEERRRAALAHRLPVDAYLEASPSLRKATEAVQILTELNVTSAQAFQARASQENRVANIVGLMIALLCLLALPLVLIVMHVWVYKPIQAIHTMIIRAKSGDRKQQVPESGVRELQQIGASFNELLDRLNQQRLTRLHFLAGVAHDLRNPLGAIRSSAEILSVERLSYEDRQPIVDVIARQSLHLERMVGDFLDSSRIEAGQLQLKKENVDLAVIVQEAVQIHQQNSGVHTIVLEAEEVTCNCDPGRLGQVMNNLLSNAIKYSPSGGRIHVQLIKGPDQAILRVSDQGLGILPDDISQIFEPFRRSAHTKATIAGLGIGLSVTKRIIEAHKGRIEVQSEVDNGTTFTVYLPYNCEPSTSHPETGAQVIELTPRESARHP